MKFETPRERLIMDEGIVVRVRFGLFGMAKHEKGIIDPGDCSLGGFGRNGGGPF